MSDNIVICYPKRTPLGHMQGMLSHLNAPELGALVIKSILEESQLDPKRITEVIMGCVLPAGLGQAPARQAAIAAGVPHQVGATTINKMCGSGMKAIMFALDGVKANPDAIYVAGGMESMTNAPYLLPKARMGYRFGHQTVYDHMLLDGLEDSYQHKAMGWFADDTAKTYDISRQAQDDFAIRSAKRAIEASDQGWFKQEIVPVYSNKNEPILEDEGPKRTRFEKIPTLKPAFQKDGSVTAANASSISDGASAMIVLSENKARSLGLKPIAKISGVASAAKEPQWFTTAPELAIKNVLSSLDLTVKDVDLFEINEAFAVVSLYAMKQLGIDENKLNIHGGACALGHPIGASGARIITTLCYALQKNNLSKGLASLCIGGGEATAIAIEMI